MWLFAILLVLVMGGVAMVASGRGAPMAEAYDDRPDPVVPAGGDLVPADLRRVRFSLAFRGYRMSEVDALLDRLAVQLGESAAIDDRAADRGAQPVTQPADEPADEPASQPVVERSDTP